MKKRISLLLAAAMMLTLVACGGGDKPAASKPAASAPAASAPAAEAFVPSTEINWIVTSKAGGGSDIYTRMISDIMKTEGMVSETFVVENITDGAGEIGRNQVAMTKAGKDADHTLLTFNSGDLMPMCLNTDNRVENFTPLAVMAVDKQLLFTGPNAKYATFEDALAAAQSGTKVVIGGSKGDDIATYEALIAELGLTQDQMSYITYDGTGDAIVACLGEHIDLVLSKPAAAYQYVEATNPSEHLEPVLALSTERYTGNLANAPTLSEVGDYNDVEVPIWRGVVGPKDMSDEAAAYWSELLGKVAESEKWKTDYLDKNKLISNYMNLEDTQAFMAQYQADYLASIGK